MRVQVFFRPGSGDDLAPGEKARSRRYTAVTDIHWDDGKRLVELKRTPDAEDPVQVAMIPYGVVERIETAED
jgi:hypothetical protein